MTSETDADQSLLRRIRGGDQTALAELFLAQRERLRRMVQLRLDRRLQGRIDPSDVIQEAFVDAARRIAEYSAAPTMPPFLWLRFLTTQRLVTLHRIHLGVKGRDARREVSLHTGPLPSADSRSLDLHKAAASNRYVRALRRLKEILAPTRTSEGCCTATSSLPTRFWTRWGISGSPIFGQARFPS